MKTEEKVNPQMVMLARESRGLTQVELADRVGMSNGKVYQVEQDKQTFSEETLKKLGKELNYPLSFFYQQGEAYLPTTISFRRRDSVPQKILMPIFARMNIARLHIERLDDAMQLPPPKPLVIPIEARMKPRDERKTGDGKQPQPIIKVDEVKPCATPQEAAIKLRKHWKVTSGPISNLTELLESNHIIVYIFDFGTERVDSRTMLTKQMRPAIIINKAMLGDRQRFSLAYELGHLVMHVFTLAALKREIEHEANEFAAEFLMPAEDIRKDFEGAPVTIARLGELKRKWGVSMQSLLYRASDLQFITDNQKRYLLSQFNELKIRRREPPELDIPKEKPLMLRNLITKYRIAKRMTIKELAATFCFEQDEFIERYGD